MKQEFLEAGKIVNTFGVRGELKVTPWSDTPDFLSQFKSVYIQEQPYKVKGVRVHGQFVLLTLAGVESIDDALPLKNKVVKVRRKDVRHVEGTHFVADLIGLEARNADTGAVFGTVTDILEYPAQDLYEVKGERTWLIPDAGDFVREINEPEGYIAFHLLEGLEL